MAHFVKNCSFCSQSEWLTKDEYLTHRRNHLESRAKERNVPSRILNAMSKGIEENKKENGKRESLCFKSNPIGNGLRAEFFTQQTNLADPNTRTSHSPFLTTTVGVCELSEYSLRNEPFQVQALFNSNTEPSRLSENPVESLSNRKETSKGETDSSLKSPLNLTPRTNGKTSGNANARGPAWAQGVSSKSPRALHERVDGPFCAGNAAGISSFPLSTTLRHNVNATLESSSSITQQLESKVTRNQIQSRSLSKSLSSVLSPESDNSISELSSIQIVNFYSETVNTSVSKETSGAVNRNLETIGRLNNIISPSVREQQEKRKRGRPPKKKEAHKVPSDAINLSSLSRSSSRPLSDRPFLFEDETLSEKVITWPTTPSSAPSNKWQGLSAFSLRPHEKLKKPKNLYPSIMKLNKKRKQKKSKSVKISKNNSGPVIIPSSIKSISTLIKPYHFYCPVCNKKCPEITNDVKAYEHIASHFDSFDCKYCKYTFETKELRREHKKEAHPKKIRKLLKLFLKIKSYKKRVDTFSNFSAMKISNSIENMRKKIDSFKREYLSATNSIWSLECNIDSPGSIEVPINENDKLEVLSIISDSLTRDSLENSQMCSYALEPFVADQSQIPISATIERSERRISFEESNNVFIEEKIESPEVESQDQSPINDILEYVKDEKEESDDGGDLDMKELEKLKELTTLFDESYLSELIYCIEKEDSMEEKVREFRRSNSTAASCDSNWDSGYSAVSFQSEIAPEPYPNLEESPEPEPVVYPFNCRICKMGFKMRILLNKHNERFHERTSSNDESD